jgi:Zinc finger C-x8-C-x5-C-x3-H type (and similar)
MKPNPSFKAWRTAPCKFFQSTGVCHKEQFCRFAHIDATGKDWHANSASTTSKAGMPSQGNPEQMTKMMPIFAKHPSLCPPTTMMDLTVETHGPPSKTSPAQGPDFEEEPSTGSVFEQFQGEDVDKVYDWVHAARQEPMAEQSVLLKDAIHIKTKQGETLRYPYEELRTYNDDGTLADQIEISAKVDVAWCAMLYGRKTKVMTHLSSALMMGAALRQEIRPRLAAKNISFSNVLFVTEDSLEESELKAASFFWSIKKVSLPVVNENRLSSVSSHLIDSVAPEHVFLKVEAWKMRAGLSVIADLDMLILNPEAMAKCLEDFGPQGRYGKRLDASGSAVMQRANSVVNFHVCPQIKESLGNRKAWGSKTAFVPTLSYCFALIRPTAALAKRYEEAMRASGTKKSSLSDQDLFSEVLQTKHLELPHTFVMFPSWWNHSDLALRRVPEIMRTLGVSHIRKVTEQMIDVFVDKFGAVHFSRAFSMTDAGMNHDTKRKLLLGASRLPEDAILCSYAGQDVSNGDFLTYFLMPVWENVVAKFDRQLEALHDVMVDSIGGESPGLGLAKALVTLSSSKQRSSQRTWETAASSSAQGQIIMQDSAPWKRPRK